MRRLRYGRRWNMGGMWLAGLFLWLSWASSPAYADSKKSFSVDIKLPDIGVSWTPLDPFKIKGTLKGLSASLRYTSTPKFDVYLERMSRILGSVHSLFSIANFLLEVSGYKEDDAQKLLLQLEKKIVSEIRQQFEAQEYEASYQAFVRADNCQKSNDLTCAMRQLNMAWVAAMRGVKKHQKSNLYQWSALAMQIGLFWRVQMKKHKQNKEMRAWVKMLPEIDAGFLKLGEVWEKAPMKFQIARTGVPLIRPTCSYVVETPFLVHSFVAKDDGKGCKHLEKDRAMAEQYKRKMIFQLARAIQNKQSSWFKRYEQDTCAYLSTKYKHLNLTPVSSCALWTKCQGDHPQGCGYTGLLHFEQGEKDAGKYFYQGCKHRDPLGCLGLGYLQEAKGKKRIASEHYKRACALKNAFGCRKFGDHLDQDVASKREPKRTKGVYALACGLGDAVSCRQRALKAAYHLSDEALFFHRRACLLWDGESCKKAGIAAYSTLKMEDAVFYLGRACVKKVSGTCKTYQKLRAFLESKENCLKLDGQVLCR
ncbi:MAG: hypothetical protein H6727_01475 [Myxococcales bacterium]|nr:hypothetical protein [Myxococcales bacterium]